MPDIETLRNCWKRDGGAPEDVLLSDLGNDDCRLNELGRRDPGLVCALLVSRPELLNKFKFDVLIRLFASPEAAEVREMLKSAIVANLVADVNKEECDNAVVCLRDKGLLELAEFEHLPAVKRLNARRYLNKALIISLIAAAAILALLCALLIFRK